MSDDREQKKTVHAKDSEVKERETKKRKNNNDEDREILSDLLYDPSQSQDQNRVILEPSPTPTEVLEEQEEDRDQEQKQEEKKEEESPPVTPPSEYHKRRKVTDAPLSVTPIANRAINGNDISGLNLDPNAPSYSDGQPADLSGLSVSTGTYADLPEPPFPLPETFVSSNTENSLSSGTTSAATIAEFEVKEDQLPGGFDSSASASETFDPNDLSAFASSVAPIELLPPSILASSTDSAPNHSIYNANPSSSSQLPPATLPSVSSSIASASILTPPNKRD